MQIKPNIGILNALIRITCGLTILACTSAKLIKKPWRESYYILIFLSAMKVAEGIVRFCPITYLFQKNEGIPEFSDNTGGQNQDKSYEKDEGTGGESPA